MRTCVYGRYAPVTVPRVKVIRTSKSRKKIHIVKRELHYNDEGGQRTPNI